MKEHLSWRLWIGGAAGALALLGVLPFALLSLCAHPSADDWYMAADTLEKGFWRSNVDFYFGLTGRYFSSALLFANPIQLSFDAFKGYSMALVLGLVVSARFAVGAWFPETSKAWLWLLAVMASVLFFWAMASPAQGLYWGTGSVGYTLPGVLSLCVAGLLGSRCLSPEWHPAPLLLVGLALLAPAITGCTEVAMAMLFAHVVALNGVFIWRHHRVSLALLVLLLATLLGVAFVILAPGNANREAWYQNEVHHHLLPALLMAVKLGLRQAAIWLCFMPFFLFSLVVMSLWPGKFELSRRHALELIVVSCVLIAATVFGGFFMGSWSMGAAIPLRAVNLVLLFFIIDWLLLLAGLVALLRSYAVEIPRAGPVLSVCALLIFGAALAGSNNNVKTAWRDLVSGDAAQFDCESAERHAMIRASDKPDMLVRGLQSRPRSLFFNDLKADPANWRNTGCARFFRKHSLGLLP
jgi:hypothetical protein